MEEEAHKSFFEKAKETVSGVVDSGSSAVAGVMNKGKETLTNETGEPNVLLIVSIFILMLVIYVIMYSYRQAKYSPYLILPVTPITKRGDIVINSDAIPDSLFSEQYSYSMWVYISDDTFKNDNEKIGKYVILARAHKDGSARMVYGIHNDNISGKRILLIRYGLSPSQDPPHDLLEPDMSAKMQDGIAICDIENIPYNTFIHISTVVYGHTLVVYLNGILVKTTTLNNKLLILNTSDTITNNYTGSITYPTFKGYISKLRYFVDVSKENGGALNDKQVYDLYLNSPYPSILEKIATTVYNKIISFKSDGSDEASNLSSFSSDKLKSQLNAAHDALARRKDNLLKTSKDALDEHESLI